MISPRKILVMMAVAIVCVGAGTVSGQPVPSACTAVLSGSPNNDVSMFLVPGGTGSPFSNCFEPGAVTVNAKITVTLVDIAGNPVVGYPHNWIALEEMNSPLGWCRNVTNPPTSQCPNFADFPTNAMGQTDFTLSYYGGGWVIQPTHVWVFLPSSGWNQIPSQLNVSYNSPDQNGDGIVNLVDLALFAMVFTGPYQYQADFNYDQVINIVDLAMFAMAMGSSCPP